MQRSGEATGTPYRAVPSNRAPAPSSLELEYMAANGFAERVHAAFKRLPEEAQPDYASPLTLRQVVVGGLARLRSLPREAHDLRREEAEFVDRVVRSSVTLARQQARAGRDVFLTLLDWARFLFEEERLAESESWCDLALELGAKSFPDLHPRLALQKAAVLLGRGDNAAAYEWLEALDHRRDLISDWKLIPGLILALGKASLLTGHIPRVRRLLFAGLGDFYPGLEQRRAIFDLLRRMHRGGLRLLAGRAGWAEKLVFAAHWAAFTAIDRSGPARHLLERAFRGALYVARHARRRAAVARAARWQPRASVLVTRAMGGVGDLLMMTPGLHALSQAEGGPVNLALPRRFFPLFAHNDDVRLIDIHQELEPSGFGRWFNLTSCPAARVESLTAPRVRRNRIEIFARALSLSRGACRRLARRPLYVVTAEERAYRDRFFEALGLAGRRVVGVQLRADESYRDYPHMEALVRALARSFPVLVFDDRPIPGFDFDDVIRVSGYPLREAFALAGGCAVLVAPDSAFVHLSAALSLPCVALFGPTDGKVRTADYPRCRFLDARRDLRCVPCWRNQDLPCALTGLSTSVCLGEIGVPRVVAAVQDALATVYATAPGAARG